MKSIKALCILLLAFALGGCNIKDDLTDCPPPFSAALTFSYLGDTNDPGMFARMIDGVTLFAYDAAGNQAHTCQLSKAELTAFQGVKLSLPAGNYKIVCWGNHFELSAHIAAETYSLARLHSPQYANAATVTSNDALYFGSYDLTVPASGVASGDIPFKGAHIDVKVYVRGFNSQRAPIVELRNLMPEYDFKMQPTQPFATTYTPGNGYDATNGVHAFLLNTLRFENTNPAVVVVRDPVTLETRHTVAVEDYIATYPQYRVSGLNEALVAILIEFTDLGVVVRIPEWEIKEVVPGA